MKILYFYLFASLFLFGCSATSSSQGDQEKSFQNVGKEILLYCRDFESNKNYVVLEARSYIIDINCRDYK